MKVTKPKDIEQFVALLKRLNYCHDGCIRAVSFLKRRKLNKKDGSLIYPFEDMEDRALCDMRLELLLNSYSGAKKDQVVVLEFKEVRDIRFQTGL